ncbi:MAG: acetyl-CoA C-acyltransferase, partial [Lachnospiraceae bacterium]|nr:acetyl-CoA C-acyltransferase [Lachnospiraceae bacterium]
HNLKPLAEFAGVAETGVNPDESPRSAIKAIEKLLEKNNMDYHDISVYECNEAFAVIDELFARRFPDASDRYNIFGGALAYGHPYGASGGIILLHALKALEYSKPGNNSRYAVCSIAAAGGAGTAVLLKHIS